MDRNSNKKLSLLICLTLGLITLAVFYQVYGFRFINFDDSIYIYENPDIQAGIRPETIKWAFTSSYAANWHPLTWLSHMLDWQLFGNNAGGHHLTSLIFHIANTLLLFIVLKQMTSALWKSAFVAALFALHPLHIESVAWVSERKDVLSTFFWLLTIWAYLRYVKQPGVIRYMLTVLTFALGLMSKPMLVTLPFVLLLLDYWPLNRLDSKRSLPRLLIEKIPLFAMSSASCIVTFIIQKKSGAMPTAGSFSFFLLFANASVSYLQYIAKMFWPVRLAIFYPHPGRDVSILYAIVSAAVLLVVTILILRFAKNRRYLVTGWFWYLGTLVPVIGLIQVGEQAMADRYTYITLTGLFIIIAWSLPELFERWRYKKIVLASSAVLVISAVSTYTYFQLRYWRDDLTLFQHALDVTENNYKANYCLAIALCGQGKLDEAIDYCSRAIRIKPDVLQPRMGMGYILRQAGRLDESAQEYQKVLQIKPDDPIALNGLGSTLNQQGKYDQAVKYFTEAVRIKPDFAAAHNNLAYTLALQGNLDKAAIHYKESLRLNPRSAAVNYHLGRVLEQKGKINQAIEHFKEAMRLNPDWDEPANVLAWYFAVNKESEFYNPDEAVRLAQHACRLTNYQKPDFLDTLAVAYAAKGDFGKAIETLEKALALCRSEQQESLKKELESRLVLFKTGKPYVEN